MKWSKVYLFGARRTIKALPDWSYTQNKKVLAERRAKA